MRSCIYTFLALVQFASSVSAQAPEKPKLPTDVDKLVASFLTQFDANKDGKIAKDEAKNRLADGFTQLDKNKDGYLDRPELRPVAEKMLAFKKGGGFFGGSPAPAGFHDLDKNADGRLTREEMRGSPLLARFAEIDVNNDGRLDPREFESFQRKKE